MESARVIIIEDDELFREMTIENLRAIGHQVVGQASTRKEALDLIDSMGRCEVEADVVLLDGNLVPDTDTYEDARIISARLKENGVTSKVLGFSLGTLSSHGIDVDADVGKLWDNVSRGIEAL